MVPILFPEVPTEWLSLKTGINLSVVQPYHPPKSSLTIMAAKSPKFEKKFKK